MKTKLKIFYGLVIIGILSALFLGWLSTYAQNYQDDRVKLTILDNGNWALTLDNINYLFEWYNFSNEGKLMKVSGDDGTCYWLYEDVEGLKQADCDLKSVSILLSNIK